MLSLLTIVHALGIVYLPFAWPLWPPRTFGSFRMPFPRTVGLAMSAGKLGILASIALATVISSSAGRDRIVRPSWARAVLFSAVTTAALISQTRSVYLDVLLAIGLSAYLLLSRRRPRPWFAGTVGAWSVTVLYAVVLIVSNLVFLDIAPQAIIDVGSAKSVANVVVRSEANTMGWLLFKQAPLLGIGHGRFQDLAFVTTALHNHFWDQFVSTGLVGGTPYLLFHMLILVSALRLLGSSEIVPGAVARALSVSVAVTYLAYQFFPGFFVSSFAVICGLVVSVRRDERRVRKLQNADTRRRAR